MVPSSASDPHDPVPVAETACFLFSDMARAITGEIVHVDGGYHAMGSPGRLLDHFRKQMS